ncbi:MAG: TrkA family potassium uptake protein [Ruminococcus sp.]|jgi:trk system potassium uptake protein TrkA|nr:TrkA family potassium uptake protein [Ruminococcus sp.]
MNIIVIGCGKVGQAIITALTNQGHDVSVVTEDPLQLSNLPSDFSGYTTIGVPIDQDILKKAGIESCDAFAAVTSDDNLNLMAAQIAKNIYNIKKVYARINDAQKNEVFGSFGISTICPTNLTASALIPLLNDNTDVTAVNHAGILFVIMTTEIEKDYIGKRVSEISTMLEEDEVIVAVKHKDGSNTKISFVNPEIKSGDSLIIMKMSD